jgi:hypothetical protein
VAAQVVASRVILSSTELVLVMRPRRYVPQQAGYQRSFIFVVPRTLPQKYAFLNMSLYYNGYDQVQRELRDIHTVTLTYMRNCVSERNTGMYGNWQRDQGREDDLFLSFRGLYCVSRMVCLKHYYLPICV